MLVVFKSVWDLAQTHQTRLLFICNILIQAGKLADLLHWYCSAPGPAAQARSKTLWHFGTRFASNLAAARISSEQEVFCSCTITSLHHHTSMMCFDMTFADAEAEHLAVQRLRAGTVRFCRLACALLVLWFRVQDPLCSTFIRAHGAQLLD